MKRADLVRKLDNVSQPVPRHREIKEFLAAHPAGVQVSDQQMADLRLRERCLPWRIELSVAPEKLTRLFSDRLLQYCSRHLPHGNPLLVSMQKEMPSPRPMVTFVGRHSGILTGAGGNWKLIW